MRCAPVAGSRNIDVSRANKSEFSAEIAVPSGEEGIAAHLWLPGERSAKSSSGPDLGEHEAIDSGGGIGAGKICHRDGTIGILAGLELTPDDKALGSNFEVVNSVVGNLLSVGYNLVQTFNKRSHQDIRCCDVLVSISLMSRLEIPAGDHLLQARNAYRSGPTRASGTSFIAIPRACQRSAA